MSQQAYFGIIIFLFLLLLIGWSKSLFWFAGGIAVGVMGLRMYDSETLAMLVVKTGGAENLVINGVYSAHPATLIEKLTNGREKQLVIKNDPNIPREKKVPEYPVGVIIPCYVRDRVKGMPLKVILTRKVKSKKNLLITPGRSNGTGKPSSTPEYYLELAPRYTKRDEHQSIIGTYALRVKDTSSSLESDDSSENTQMTEKHTRLLKGLASLLKKVWCGEKPKGLTLIGASKHSGEIPEQGPVSLLKNVSSQMHTLSGDDLIRGEDKIRGDVKVTYDDETIIMPVVEKHYPTGADVIRMPLYETIKRAAENATLVVVLQDYITGGLAEGRELPKNVIYVGQALRLDAEKKLYLNAFVNPLCYDYVLLALQAML